jgi:hypothetical protein
MAYAIDPCCPGECCPPERWSSLQDAERAVQGWRPACLWASRGVRMRLTSTTSSDAARWAHAPGALLKGSTPTAAGEGACRTRLVEA